MDVTIFYSIQYPIQYISQFTVYFQKKIHIDQNYCGMSKLYTTTIEPQCRCEQCRWHKPQSNLVAKLFCGVGTCVHNKTTYLPPYVWTQFFFCRAVVEGAPKPQPLNYGK